MNIVTRMPLSGAGRLAKSIPGADSAMKFLLWLASGRISATAAPPCPGSRVHRGRKDAASRSMVIFLEFRDGLWIARFHGRGNRMNIQRAFRTGTAALGFAGLIGFALL